MSYQDTAKGIAVSGQRLHESECEPSYCADALNLALNECPHEIPELVWSRMAMAIVSSNRYPMNGEEAVIRRIADRFALPPSSVMLTQGIDEAIDRLIEEFRGMRFVLVQPGFDGYTARLQTHGQSFQILTLDGSFQIRHEDLAQIRSTDFVAIANPNNPTGSLFREESVREIASRCGGMLIDETYVDFSRHADYLNRRNSNMFVFRSFSKSYALAGLRIGFLAGGAANIASMRNRQWFCNMNMVSLAAVSAALESDYNLRYALQIVSERRRLTEAALSMGFSVVPTVTNFFLIADESGGLLRHLERQDILVRDTARYGMPGYLRISVGTREANDRLIAALSTYSLDEFNRIGND